MTECFGPNGGTIDPTTGRLVPDVGYTPLDPNDPNDDYDCASIAAAGIDICDYIAQFPNSNIATLDCDGGGVDNLTECFGPNGGTIDPVTGELIPDAGYTPNDPADASDECTAVIAAGLDICAIINGDAPHPLASLDCDGGGVDNLTECNAGFDPADSSDECDSAIAANVDICSIIMNNPNHPLAMLDCDGGGVDNLTECQAGTDPSNAGDDCTAAITAGLDICAILAADATHPLATADCDGGGVDNATECARGGDPSDSDDDCSDEVPTITVNGPNCAGDPIELMTSSTGTNFEWIGPLGASQSTLMMPGLTTGTPSTTIDSSNPAYLSGDWRVRITDANGCVSLSDPIGIGINDVPLAIIINNGDVCDGEVVQLAANTVPGATYAWYDAEPAMGGVLISQDQAIEFFDMAPATYTYFLQVDANGCPSEVASSSITVNELPSNVPDFAYMSNIDCAAADLSLSANATGNGPFTYLWTGPNGFTSTLENPVIPGAATLSNGSYTCLLYTSPSPRDATLSRMPSSA